MKFNDYAKQFIGYNGKIFIDYYNGKIKPIPRGYRVKYSDAWCATFASVVMHACNGLNPPYECSVYQMYKKAQNRGYLLTKTDKIEPGDFIVYDWGNDGSLNHVGIIDTANAKSLTVIEGNYNNKVGIRKISLQSNEIEGYFRVPNESVIHTVNTESGQIADALILDIIRGKYGNGKDRKKNLENLGYNYAKVQYMVNEYLRK